MSRNRYRSQSQESGESDGMRLEGGGYYARPSLELPDEARFKTPKWRATLAILDNYPRLPSWARTSIRRVTREVANRHSKLGVESAGSLPNANHHETLRDALKTMLWAQSHRPPPSDPRMAMQKLITAWDRVGGISSASKPGTRHSRARTLRARSFPNHLAAALKRALNRERDLRF